MITQAIPREAVKHCIGYIPHHSSATPMILHSLALKTQDKCQVMRLCKRRRLSVIHNAGPGAGA